MVAIFYHPCPVWRGFLLFTSHPKNMETFDLRSLKFKVTFDHDYRRPSEHLHNLKNPPYEGEAETVYIPYLQIAWELSEPTEDDLIASIGRILVNELNLDWRSIISVDYWFNADGDRVDEDGNLILQCDSCGSEEVTITIAAADYPNKLQDGEELYFCGEGCEGQYLRVNGFCEE